MKNGKSHITIFFGGEAGSHDLSSETGERLCHYLPRTSYRLTPVRITPQGKWQVPLGSLPQQGPIKKIIKNLFQAVRAVSPKKGLERLLHTPVDALMTVVRGRGGDDGTLHGLGNALGIPVVGSGAYACQQTNDKHACGRRLENIVSAPVHRRYRQQDDLADIMEEAQELFVPPLFVKPCRQEGSWGVAEVASHDELAPAIKAAQQCGDILIQQRSPGTELTVTLFDDERGKVHKLPSVVVVPQRTATFYDHLAKRRKGRVILHTPHQEMSPLMEEAEALARDVYDELDCRGPVSFDIVADEDTAELLDVNIIPTLTTLTPLMAQMKAAGMHPGTLFSNIIRRSLNGES